MLVLSRKPGEAILIGDNIEITILSNYGSVRLGINAPKNVRVVRNELVGRTQYKPKSIQPSLVINYCNKHENSKP